MTVERLFEPLELNNGVTIKNRLYKGAMSEGMADGTTAQRKPSLMRISTGLMVVSVWRLPAMSWSIVVISVSRGM